MKGLRTRKQEEMKLTEMTEVGKEEDEKKGERTRERSRTRRRRTG